MNRNEVVNKISTLPSDFDVEVGCRGGRFKGDYKILKESNSLNSIAETIISDLKASAVIKVNYFKAVSTSFDDGHSDDHLFYFFILDCD